MKKPAAGNKRHLRLEIRRVTLSHPIHLLKALRFHRQIELNALCRFSRPLYSAPPRTIPLVRNPIPRHSPERIFHLLRRGGAMAGRRMDVLDIREMVRRFKLGQSDRQVAGEVGSNRRSVARYRKFAKKEGWLDRPELPTAGQIEARLENRKIKRKRQALKFSTRASHSPEQNEISSRPVGKGADLGDLRIELEWRPPEDREEAWTQNAVCAYQFSFLLLSIERIQTMPGEVHVRVPVPALRQVNPSHAESSLPLPNPR